MAELFSFIDVDNDGRLSRDEYMAYRTAFEEHTRTCLEQEQPVDRGGEGEGGGDVETGQAGTSLPTLARLGVNALERSKAEAAKRGKLVKDLVKVEAKLATIRQQIDKIRTAAGEQAANKALLAFVVFNSSEVRNEWLAHYTANGRGLLKGFFGKLGPEFVLRGKTPSQPRARLALSTPPDHLR